MNAPGYNPQSIDAMFTRVLTEIENVKSIVAEARDEARKTNGRVTKLEFWRQYSTGKTAGIALAVSVGGTVIGWFLTH